MVDYVKSYGYLSFVQPELRMFMNSDRDNFRNLFSNITPVSDNLKLWLFASSFQWSQVVSCIPDYSFRLDSEIEATLDRLAAPKGDQKPEFYKLRYKIGKGVYTPGASNMIALVVALDGKDAFAGESIYSCEMGKFTPLLSVGENVVLGYRSINGQSIELGYAYINPNMDLETLGYNLELSKWSFVSKQILSFPELDITGSIDIVRDKFIHFFQGTEDTSYFYKAKSNCCMSYIRYNSSTKKYVMDLYKFTASSSNVLNVSKSSLTFIYLSILGTFDPRNFYYSVRMHSSGDTTLALYIDKVETESELKYILKVNKGAEQSGTWEEIDITSKVLGIAGENEVEFFSFLGTLSTNILVKLVYKSGESSDIYAISSLLDKDSTGRYKNGLYAYKGTLPNTADIITSAFHSNYPYIEYIDKDGEYRFGIESFTLGIWDISNNPFSRGVNESITLELNIEDK